MNSVLNGAVRLSAKNQRRFSAGSWLEIKWHVRICWICTSWHIYKPGLLPLSFSLLYVSPSLTSTATTTYFLHQDSLHPLLECHSSPGEFNVAFNPHCLIITLTFTLHSIKFLTADLLQWLLVLQEAAVIMLLIKRLSFNAAFSPSL